MNQQTTSDQSTFRRPSGWCARVGAAELRQRRLILVAEDNEIDQKVVRQQLVQLRFAMDVVGNVREAMQALQHESNALLLTDLQMPDTDGYDPALGTRAREAGKSRLPIFALTANALAGEVREFLQAFGNGVSGMAAAIVAAPAARCG